MKLSSVDFTTILVLLGLVLLAVFLAHTFGRGLHRSPESPRWEISEADPARGRMAIDRHGCAACHVIPGVRRSKGRVGPKLEDFRNQIFIAGMLPNTPENLILWIQSPQEVNPGTAMPNLGLTDQEARDIAAYLYQNP
jgi:cytochrome c